MRTWLGRVDDSGEHIPQALAILPEIAADLWVNHGKDIMVHRRDLHPVLAREVDAMCILFPMTDRHAITTVLWRLISEAREHSDRKLRDHLGICRVFGVSAEVSWA